ncbi:hypothetical protein [Paenibacillus sp. MMO-177]|uniref:hypothetical protein n=1 Tax=Paenibacillus sp. MMO-177 TaxID=3081289 RepID=UPI0030186EB1
MCVDAGRQELTECCSKIALTGLSDWEAYAYPYNLSGHFAAELSYERDEGLGLALVAVKDGIPNPDHYTSIQLRLDGDGIQVEVHDCQAGTIDVLDNTDTLSAKQRQERYRTDLTGQLFSVPFNGTAGQLRMEKDKQSGFFHFFYAVGMEINGNWRQDWMELAPSMEWLGNETEYLVALLLPKERTSFEGITRLTASPRPERDHSDRETGFRVIKRSYHWSGAAGEAYVISFDKRFAYHGQDIKFVFWDQMNHVPAWHMNDQLLFTYEFVESWVEEEKGCFEPMSDRLNAFNSVEVKEDHEVRKVICWRYLLTNPDYRVWPDSGEGSDQPEVEEHYVFYPDGTGIRHIRYYPKLDTKWRNWHELEESIIIAGTQTKPSDHIHEIPLTLLNLTGDAREYDRSWYDRNSQSNGQLYQLDDRSVVEAWDETIQAIHFTNGIPDVFIAFPNVPGPYEVCPESRSTTDISWHSYHYEMSHWPVNKEPYQEPFKSGTTWTGQVSHSSVAGVEAWNDVAWERDYKIDDRGRPYREWMTLIGVHQPFDRKGLRERIASWLHPAKIVVSSGEAAVYQHAAMEYLIDAGYKNKVQLTIELSDRADLLIRPCLRITNSVTSEHMTVLLNGSVLQEKQQYRVTQLQESCLVWLDMELHHASELELLWM